MTFIKDPLMSIAKTFLPNLVKDDKFGIMNGVSYCDTLKQLFLCSFFLILLRKMERFGKILPS